MRRAILLGALALFCACRPGMPEYKGGLEEYQLNCAVKSILVKGSITEENYLLEFDHEGHPVSKIFYNTDGDFQCQEIYEYDDSSRLCRIDYCENLDAMNSWKEIEYSGEFKVREIHYGNSGEDMVRVDSENDGQHIIHSRFYREGMFEYETFTEYTDTGLVERMLDADGWLEGTAVVGFFAPGRVSSIETDELSLSVQYDSATGLPVRSRGAQVDSRGGVLWQEENEATERRYEYGFDRFGNWTTRREFVGDSLVTTISRRIRY